MVDKKIERCLSKMEKLDSILLFSKKISTKQSKKIEEKIREIKKKIQKIKEKSL